MQGRAEEGLGGYRPALRRISANGPPTHPPTHPPSLPSAKQAHGKEGIGVVVVAMYNQVWPCILGCCRVWLGIAGYGLPDEQGRRYLYTHLPPPPRLL